MRWALPASNRRPRALFALVAAGSLLLAAGCSHAPGRVEEPAGSGWRAVALELDGIEGGRDGYRTNATVKFTGPGSGRLRMDLVVVVDPRASLESGSWSYDGPTGPAEGSVVPEHILFAGGQGDGVSLGGSYLLQADGVTRFRVSLRPQALGRGGWKASSADENAETFSGASR